MAAYPTSVKSFGTAHQDFTENILAAHVNDVQDEIVAIETNLGVNPHVGQDLVGTSTTYSNLKARIDAIMAGVRSHTHSGTDGVKLAQANTHQSADTDVATTSLHHTIGGLATQAAAGNHTHGSAAQTTFDAHVAGTAVHGATGAVVGTTNTQTVQNKTLDGTNTFPSTLATLAGTQAMSNKDLTAATNSFPATLATATDLTNHAAVTVTHGATGAVMGTTNTQSPTNKNMSAVSNVLTHTVANLAARDALSKYVGMKVRQTDTGQIWDWTGTTFVPYINPAPWTKYSDNASGVMSLSNITAANYTHDAYVRITSDRICHLKARFTINNTSTGRVSVLGLPPMANYWASVPLFGVSLVLRVGVNSAISYAYASASANSANLLVSGAAPNTYYGDTGYAFTSGCFIDLDLVYETTASPF